MRTTLAALLALALTACSVDVDTDAGGPTSLGAPAVDAGATLDASADAAAPDASSPDVDAATTPPDASAPGPCPWLGYCHYAAWPECSAQLERPDGTPCPASACPTWGDGTLPCECVAGACAWRERDGG